MLITGFILLFLAIPVLLAGEAITNRVGVLRRSHIPPPVISGLAVALAILLYNFVIVPRMGGADPVVIDSKVTFRPWTWITMPEIEWFGTVKEDGTRVYPAKNVYDPLLIAFFTCIGLNASWAVAKKGSWQLLLYLAIATAFVVVQNGVGVILAKILGVSPLMGLMCSGVALMGGFGTAAGFAGTFEKAGLVGAATIGTAAAAFGVITGSLVGGPVGRYLVEKKVVIPPPRERGFDVVPSETREVAREAAEVEQVAEHENFITECLALLRLGSVFVLHLLVLLACIKAGAWVYYLMTQAGLTFPVYIGAMIVGLIVRNISDILPRPFVSTDVVDRIASVSLAWLLAAVMISLNLAALANSALPMLVIVFVQILVMIAFAVWVVFRAMGRDYEAATMSVGMIGFGLGATSNAVATMKQMTRAYGPAPRAFLIVTVVGAFLIDFTNSVLITISLNLLK